MEVNDEGFIVAAEEATSSYHTVIQVKLQSIRLQFQIDIKFFVTKD
jgi:hypothetical protein